MTDTVVNDPDRSRYSLLRDGTEIGFAVYRRPDEGVIVFVHTVVDESIQEHGLGSMLVKAALDDVRGSSDRVVAECPFVAAYIERHPEYGDLLER